MTVPLWLLLPLALQGSPRTWEEEIAERVSDAPNPYRGRHVRLSDPGLEPTDADFPEFVAERSWFQMEHTADMMGRQVAPGLTVGLAVEFVGFAEFPKPDRHMTNHLDPFHPRFLLVTANLRMKF